MKSLLKVFMLCSVALVISEFSCSTSQNPDINAGLSVKMEGWQDDNTYRVIADGKPAGILKDQNKRRESAKNAAIRNAQFKLMKRFNVAGLNVRKMKKVKAIIKRGYVVENGESYSSDDSCDILYEVSSDDLKKMLDYQERK